MKYLLIIYVFTSLFLISSCKKNNTRMSLLTEKKWQRTSMIVKLVTGGQTRDAYPDLPEYEKDDYYIFHKDNTYEFNDNVLRNSSANSMILDHGYWYFTEGEDYLQLQNTVRSIPRTKILTLTKGELITQSDYGEYISYKVIK